MKKKKLIMTVDEFSLMIRKKDEIKLYRRYESAWHNHNKFSIALCTFIRVIPQLEVKKKKEIKQFTFC